MESRNLCRYRCWSTHRRGQYSRSTPEITERLDKLLIRLPTHFEQKKTFGEPPVTELFITRRLEAHQAKWERWVEAGKLSKSSKLWEVIKITNAMELGIFWSTTGSRSPPESVRLQIDHFSSMTPTPKYNPSNPSFSGAYPPSSPTATYTTKSYNTKNDLDSLDEISIRDLLLGTLYLSLGDASSLEIAQSYFKEIASNSASIVEERWTVAFGRFQTSVAVLKGGDLKIREGGADKKAIWKPVLLEAEKHLDVIATIPEFDFKNRLESRTLMLRNEIAAKRKQVGL